VPAKASKFDQVTFILLAHTSDLVLIIWWFISEFHMRELVVMVVFVKTKPPTMHLRRIIGRILRRILRSLGRRRKRTGKYITGSIVRVVRRIRIVVRLIESHPGVWIVDVRIRAAPPT